MTKRRRPRWAIALVLIALGFVVYLIIGEFFWQNSHLVGNSADAIVQPAPSTGAAPASNPAEPRGVR